MNFKRFGFRTTMTGVIGLVLLLSGCSAKEQTVAVVVTDQSVKPATATATAGKVTFSVTNNGVVEHEFVVLKTDLAPAALKMETATKADEDTTSKNAGEVEGVAPGTTKQLTLDLKPGKYVLLCNLDGHYKMGMFAGFEVK